VQSFTAPAIIQRGTTYSVALTVRNNGGAAANLVLPPPNPPTESSTGGASGNTTPVLTPRPPARGAPQTFRWRFVENGSGRGTLQYTTVVTGTAATSGAALSTGSSSTTTATVQGAADLEVTAFTLSQGTLSMGQGFTASITVHNRGGTTANNVLPSPTP